MGADVRARAIGSFFGYGGQAYFGEYPMSFAAALGHKEMVLLLHRHGATPHDRDAQGNTALHITIYHGQKEMYDYMIDVIKANEFSCNLHGLTPLMKAAALGDAEMFSHIIGRRKQVVFRYGNLTSYWLPLEELDATTEHADYEKTVFAIALRTG